jgi:hypothetical protein
MGLQQIFNDGAGFGDPRVALVQHRRLAERVDGLQGGGRQHGLRVALIPLHLIGQAHFLQQPEDPLRAGIVEVVDGDHGAAPLGSGS